MERPSCIKHWQELQEPDNASYPDSSELLSIGSPLGRFFGLQRIGIHHELLPPGRRTSWPHAEKTEDEFVYVLEGEPDVWLDGVLHRLRPGDAVGFPAGSGIAHSFLNNTAHDVRLLCVGDRDRDDNQLHYPLHPARNSALGPRHWQDCPGQLQGEHDGLPDALRAQQEHD
ncbi:cupin [Aquitalea magnusonii]|nr:cupin [Aquitalea magnusonii]